MTIAYIPPGVSVTELTSPAVTPLLALPGSVCLIGLATGYITRTDTITLTGTTASSLPGLPTGATLSTTAVQLVMDVTNPSLAPNGFSATTDYSFNNAAGTITRQVTTNTLATAVTAGANSITLSTGPVPAAGQIIRLTNSPTTETQTVLSVSGQTVTLVGTLVNAYPATSTSVAWGNIPDGDSVYVTYNYTPADYFQPIRLTSMTDIQTRFGNAWDPTNTKINSPLSFAASLAFQNGASNIVLQPLFVETSGVYTQPTATQAASPAVWASVFNGLLSLSDINLIVPIIGQSMTGVTDSIQLQVFEALQDFVYQMLTENDIYVYGLFGEDSSQSNTVAQEPTLIGHAQTIIPRYGGAVTEQLSMINIAQLSMSNQTSSFLVGAQYAAAALAGFLSAQQASASVTRVAISGFTAVTDYRTKSQMNNDAANGMLVLQNTGNVVQVRHGITMDQTNVATREMNVVRAKAYIVQSVSQTLNTQVIGQVVADDNAAATVETLVIGTLEDLRTLGYLVNYGNVSAALVSLDPTTMTVSFSYSPAFMINYIDVQFTLDLTSQSLSVTTTSAATTL